MIDHNELIERILQSSSSVFGLLCLSDGTLKEVSESFRNHFDLMEQDNLYKGIRVDSHEILSFLLNNNHSDILHFLMPHDFLESFSCYSEVREEGTYLVLIREKINSSDLLKSITRDRNYMHQRLLQVQNENADLVWELYQNSKTIQNFFYLMNKSEKGLIQLIRGDKKFHKGQLRKVQNAASKNLNILETFMESKKISPHMKMQLSHREQEVMSLIKESKTNKEISHILFVSESTVKSHIYKIFSKLHIKSRKELIDKK